MSTNKWIVALKQYNTEKGGSWCVPRKGTEEYDKVRAIMDELGAPSRSAPKRKLKLPPVEVEQESDEVSRRRARLQQLRRKFKLPPPEVERESDEAREAREGRNISRRQTAMEQLRQVEAETKARNVERKASAPSSKYEKAYKLYVDDYDARKKDAAEYRETIQRRAASASREDQYSRFMGAVNIHFPIDDEPKLSFAEFVAREEARAAYAASAPERYIRALDRAEAETRKKFEEAQKPADLSDLIKPIPSKKPELLALIKEKGIKGFSGKSIDELKEMLEKWNERYVSSQESSKSYAMKAATERLYQIGAFRVLMGLDKSQLEKMFSLLRKKRDEEQAKLNRFRANIPRRVSTKEEGDKVSAQIDELNKATLAFNKKYQDITKMVQGAITYKDTNKYSVLETDLQFNMGIPEPIEVYLKELE